jgi:hypothetical protein
MSARAVVGRGAGLQLRAFCPIAALARAAGVPPYKLLRLMRRCRVVFIHAGRSFYVPLSEIREKIPSLWRGIRTAEDLRQAADDAEQKMPRLEPAGSRGT